MKFGLNCVLNNPASKRHWANVDLLLVQHLQHCSTPLVYWEWSMIDSSSCIQLSAIARLLYITHMCYEYRTPLLPGQLRQPRRSDLSVTSTLQSVNQWHNEYSCCSHPSRWYNCKAHLLPRSDQWSAWQTWRGKVDWLGSYQINLILILQK